MSLLIYFDTSALAKWYINESGSDDVENYIQQHGPVAISDLTIVEMRCLLSRRRRDGSLTGDAEIRVWATFQEDVRQKHLTCYLLPDKWAEGAVNLVSMLTEIPLRTLDAVHLLIAKEIQANVVATADRVMTTAAQAMGFSVVFFGRVADQSQ
jgi:predicted nucleic acid-binding protein